MFRRGNSVNMLWNSLILPCHQLTANVSVSGRSSFQAARGAAARYTGLKTAGYRSSQPKQQLTFNMIIQTALFSFWRLQRNTLIWKWHTDTMDVAVINQPPGLSIRLLMRCSLNEVCGPQASTGMSARSGHCWLKARIQMNKTAAGTPRWCVQYYPYPSKPLSIWKCSHRFNMPVVHVVCFFLERGGHILVSWAYET